MANSRDFTGKNRKFTGTKGITVSKGTTAERVGSESGELRFNTSTDLMEYYDGTIWKPIDAPPSISSVTTNDATGSNIILNSDGSTIYTITINGNNFTSSVDVKFIGSTGTQYTAGNVNRVSISQITCTTLSSMSATDDPYAIRVTNTTANLFATLENALTFNAPPVFVNSTKVFSAINTNAISGSTINVSATDAESNTITYTLASGSLPSGLTLSSSTGYITGTPSDTSGNYPFVVRAATTEGTVERQFSIQLITLPSGGTITDSGTFKIHTFTDSGSFVVSSGFTRSAEYLVVAGGGGGGADMGGGGGAGGLLTGTTTISPQTYTITIGSGGAGAPAGPSGPKGSSGQDSVALGVTATGGGGGGSGYGSGNANALNGGSGGGGAASNGSGGSGTAGQGTSGGTHNGNYYSGGGGGASQAGRNGNEGSHGGAGTTNSINGTSYVWAGGGGGGGYSTDGGDGGSGGGGGGAVNTAPGGTGGINNGAAGGGGSPVSQCNTPGGNAGENTGSGGGGGSHFISNNYGGNGAKGIVIIKYDTA